MTATSGKQESGAEFRKRLHDEDIPGVLERLAKMETRPTRFDFTGSKLLTPAGWAKIAEALLGAGLEELVLKDCDLNDEKVPGLLGLLASAKGSLKRLDLSENRKLTSAGWGQLGEALLGAGLEDFVLSDCALNDEKVAGLLGLLASAKGSLKRLHLSWNRNLTSAGWGQLGEALLGAGLEELVLLVCDLNDEKVSGLLGLLAGAKGSLKRLDLSVNRDLTSAGWGQLGEALDNAALEEVRLTHISFSAKGLAVVTDALGRMGACLKKVDLNGANGVSRSGWKVALNNMSKLRLVELDIQNCNLTDDVLEEFLRDHPSWATTLVSVNMGGNQMPRPLSALAATMACPSDLESSAPRLLSSGKAQPIVLWRTVVSVTTIESEFARKLPAPLMTPFMQQCPNLRHLTLGDINEQLLGAMRMNGDFESLVLRGEFAPADWEKLAEALGGACLEEVDVGQCRLDDETGSVVAGLLAATKGSLKRLQFQANGDLTSAGWGRLAEALGGACLEEVDVSLCKLNDEKAFGVAALLAATKGSLKRLRFRENRDLTSAGWGRLAEALGGACLEEVDVTKSALNDEKASVVAELLAATKGSLKRLRLGINGDLTSAGWGRLAEALGGACLEEVDVSDCKLDDERASVVAALLAATKGSLKRLRFWGNGDLTSAGWGRLAEALGGGCLEEVNFNGCHLNDEQALGVAALLAATKGSLKGLVFAFNSGLTSAGWGRLAEALTGASLEELYLYDCSLDDEKASRLGDLLAGAKSSLKVLDMSNNSLTHTFRDALRQALPNTTIEF